MSFQITLSAVGCFDLNLILLQLLNFFQDPYVKDNVYQNLKAWIDINNSLILNQTQWNWFYIT